MDSKTDNLKPAVKLERKPAGYVGSVYSGATVFLMVELGLHEPWSSSQLHALHESEPVVVPSDAEIFQRAQPARWWPVGLVRSHAGQ